MKKGFTLIELLAVIVILAIVACIATPIIFGIVNQSIDSGNISSIRGYADTIKLARYEKVFKKEPVNDDNLLDLEIVTNREDIKCTTIKYDNIHEVILNGCTMKTSDKTYCLLSGHVYSDETCLSPNLDGVQASDTSFTKDNVILTFNNNYTGELSYSCNNGETWQTDNEYIIETNGTYTCLIKNAFGAYSEPVEITINNIDKESPNFDLTPTQFVYGVTSDLSTIITNKTDNVTTSDNLTVSINPATTEGLSIGTHTVTVIVTDEVGNKLEKSVDITITEPRYLVDYVNQGTYVTFPSAKGNVTMRVLTKSGSGSTGTVRMISASQVTSFTLASGNTSWNQMTALATPYNNSTFASGTSIPTCADIAYLKSGFTCQSGASVSIYIGTSVLGSGSFYLNASFDYGRSSGIISSGTYKTYKRTAGTSSNGIRIALTSKAGIIIASGEGTSSSPYLMGKI